MTTIDRTQQGTFDFFNQRIDAWVANATDLTLSLEDTTQLAALLADAETKFDEAKESWNEYRAKVDAQDEALAALYDFGSLLVQQIRVAAKKDGTNQLYQLAQIDPPKPATPRTEAPIPTNLTTTNTTSGDIELSFKGSKAGGAVFEVQRQLREVGQQPGAWGYVATIGEKRYVDTAVPSGLAQISYRVRTQLTTGVLSQWSYPAPFYFGNGQQSEATGAQQAQATAETDGGETLTIEDAQALKDAQTAKGGAKAG